MITDRVQLVFWQAQVEQEWLQTSDDAKAVTRREFGREARLSRRHSLQDHYILVFCYTLCAALYLIFTQKGDSNAYDMNENDFYALLEVSESASSDDIKARIYMPSL